MLDFQKTKTETFLYQILLLGDTGVGKTSFVKRAVNKEFSNDYEATVGADFAVKEMTRPVGQPSRLLKYVLLSKI